ncbi:sensor histidine kinase [Sphingosinicella rhizophila]|uniref:sensor histidine kinase n=1 Tax=Sphingosinicella rhizophila TaxID=3050082 RepID=UPI0028E9906D|nr:HAMP domain-containing sensor histidine kinase [Sphingosinicella sp. GR2756]
MSGALWITLIALVTTSLALTVQYVQTARLLEARTRALVNDEAASLVSRYRAAGLSGIAQAIRREVEVPRINEFLYLLATPGGRPLVGNLAEWPSAVDHPGYHRFETEVFSASAPVRESAIEARAVLLPDGFRLLVGNLSDESIVLQDRYFSALIWSLLATGLLGLALGFWYSRRGLAFLRAASDAGERFLRGKLDERLPAPDRGDEYDRLAATINRTFEEIERLIGSLRAATDGLAHDLKTPITRIRARLELAEMQQADAEELHAVIAECRDDLDAILRLILDVLELAHAEAIADIPRELVQLDHLLQEAVELYQPLAEDRGVGIEVTLVPVALAGSRSLLARMAANLLDNAIKHSPKGETVRVDLTVQDGAATLTIADRGPGIAETQRERALQRFTQLDASRSQPGSGLGLSIVAAAARVHNAQVVLTDNEPGLNVRVLFPETETA